MAGGRATAAFPALLLLHAASSYPIWSSPGGEDLALRGGTCNSTLAYLSNPSGVYLQGFNWDLIANVPSRAPLYAALAGLAPSLAGVIDGVWLPPISQAADHAGYLPGRYYELRDEAALRSALRSLADAGIMAICDIVVNHRTGASLDACSNEYTAFEMPDWGNWAVVRDDWKCEGGVTCPPGCACGGGDTGDNLCAAPDVDHTDGRVQADIQAFVAWLRGELGFAGLRFDMVKGFAPQYVGLYAKGACFAVGEFYDGDVGKVSAWVDSAQVGAFDFPLRFFLHSALGRDSYEGLSGAGLVASKPAMAATFLENHDTERDDPFNKELLMKGYVYILTHPGTPFVFYSHWFSLNDNIKKLIALRKAAKVTTDTKVTVERQESGLYAAYVGSDKICDGFLLVKIGARLDWEPCGAGWGLELGGGGWAVWSRQQPA